MRKPNRASLLYEFYSNHLLLLLMHHSWVVPSQRDGSRRLLYVWKCHVGAVGTSGELHDCNLRCSAPSTADRLLSVMG